MTPMAKEVNAHTASSVPGGRRLRCKSQTNTELKRGVHPLRLDEQYTAAIKGTSKRAGRNGVQEG